MSLDRLLLECRETTTNVIKLVNQKVHRQYSELIRKLNKWIRTRSARFNVCWRVTICFVFTFDWGRKLRELFNHSLSVVIHNQSNRKFLSLINWKPLYCVGVAKNGFAFEPGERVNSMLYANPNSYSETNQVGHWNINFYLRL